FDDALNALANREARFFASDFLAPVLRGRGVVVRIAGALCAMRVRPASFQGWAVCQPDGPAGARVVRPATLAERPRCLAALPRVGLVVCAVNGRQVLGLPERGDSAVPVHLTDDVEKFEAIEARFDGVRHWFDRTDNRQNPAAAAHLRDALRQMAEPERLDRLA